MSLHSSFTGYLQFCLPKKHSPSSMEISYGFGGRVTNDKLHYSSQGIMTYPGSFIVFTPSWL